MPEQFTESAKQALKLARQTAKACGHSYVVQNIFCWGF